MWKITVLYCTLGGEYVRIAEVLNFIMSFSYRSCCSAAICPEARAGLHVE